jgi:tetratricopeptide (TPR) repeat protein
MKSSSSASESIIVCLLALATLPSLTHVAQAQDIGQLTKDQWLEDLDFVAKTMIDNHPDISYRITRGEFEVTVGRAKRKIRNSRSGSESLVAIRQVVASIRDGHTALGMGDIEEYGKLYPVRLYEFADGVFITGIASEHAEHVGARVLKIGRLSAEDAFGRAGTLAFADNDFARKNQAPMIVARCLVAHGLGIVESVDELPLVVEAKNGERAEISLSAVTPTGASNLAVGMDIGPEGVPFASARTGMGEKLPLYLKDKEANRNYWYEHDKAHKAIYMQFNLIIDHEDESFEDFYGRMFEYIDDHAGSIDKFILDLRFNTGGNGLMVIPFINELIKRDNIHRLGHLYTIIGRRSFSAAVLLVAEMMIHTKTLLVGEPAGAAQNMFSDMVNGGTLPNSGATLYLSSEHINIAWPACRNYMIPPHYPTPLHSFEFFSGRDPAVEAIRSNKVRAVGMVLEEDGAEAALKYFKEIEHDWGVHTDELGITPFTFPISRKYNGEYGVDYLGHRLMDEGKTEEARKVFELNVNLFPSSFNAWNSHAECLMNIGNKPEAIESYRKSLELNPDNENAADMIRRLENEIR